MQFNQTNNNAGDVINNLDGGDERPRTNYCRFLVGLLLRTFPGGGAQLGSWPPVPVRPLVGAEVGVALGHLSNWLLADLPGLTLWMVDEWTTYPEGHQYRQSGDRRARLTLEEQLARMRKAQVRCAHAIDRARLVRAASVEAAGWLQRAGVLLDFVFIDASHTYEDVARDMAAWFPLLRAGGLFSGHDYGHHRQHGVKRAVDEFFAAHPALGPVQRGTEGAESVWYCLKPGEQGKALIDIL